jgi:hypothetical protein
MLTIAAVKMMRNVVHHRAFSRANLQYAAAATIAKMAVAVPNTDAG